jgi:hypothetical protein
MSSGLNVPLSKLIACYLLATLYFIDYLLCFTSLVLICAREPMFLRKRQKIFYILLSVLTFVRIFFWIARAYVDSKALNDFQYLLFHMSWTLPALLLLSTYSMLIWWWADQYSKLKPRDMRSTDIQQLHFKVVLLVNFVMYLIEIAIMVIGAFSRELFAYIQPNYLSVLYVSAIVFFVVYGGRWYCSFRHNPVGGQARIKLHRVTQILWTTIIVVVSFVIRAIVNPFVAGYITGWTYEWIFFVFFYVIVELLPIFLILVLMTKLPHRRSHTRNPLLKYEIVQSQ